ncbi:hypothetical protein ACTSKR_11500 [Chitinibacteraceae bacterium HSL-7]
MSHYDEICSAEQFQKDTAGHQMTVIRDDGVYRHLRFKKPNTINCYFDIVTWPGYLAITGDMGANLFSRLNDMFEFFRTDRERGGRTINPSYWCEKLQCDGERHAAEEWSVEKHNANINHLFSEFLESCELDEEERAELEERVEDELLDPEDEYTAISALSEWDDRNFRFYLCDLPSSKEFTFHYIWRCRAIAWAIEQYDAMKSSTQEPQA